jgi:hypothetical protein
MRELSSSYLHGSSDRDMKRPSETSQDWNVNWGDGIVKPAASRAKHATVGDGVSRVRGSRDADVEISYSGNLYTP